MRILLFIGGSDFGRIVTNNLDERHEIVGIIQEESKSKFKLLKYRIKRLGLFKALGQFTFIVFSRFMKKSSSDRIKQILLENNLSIQPIINSNLLSVKTINESQSEDFIINNDFDVVVVTGTGIIKQNILNLINVPIINIHVGITPQYRGVHGAYWALVNNDKEHCGVTLHLIDEGVDTGAILEQKNIEITKSDNFTTYPYLQFSEAVKSIDKAFKNEILNEVNNDISSKQYFHPSIFEYLYFRFTKGIK